MDEIKPCPCGGKVTLGKLEIIGLSVWDVLCNDCLAYVSDDSEETAIKKWNDFVDEWNRRLKG